MTNLENLRTRSTNENGANRLFGVFLGCKRTLASVEAVVSLELHAENTWPTPKSTYETSYYMLYIILSQWPRESAHANYIGGETSLWMG